MSQIKIFGFRDHLGPITQRVSDVVHSGVVGALQYPLGKRAHRFCCWTGRNSSIPRDAVR